MNRDEIRTEREVFIEYPTAERTLVTNGQRRGKSMLAAMAMAMAMAGAPTAISAANSLPRAPARGREHIAEPVTSKDLAAIRAAQAKRDRRAAKRIRDARIVQL